MFLLLLLNAVSLLCSVLFGKTKIFCLKIPPPKHQINIYIDKILRPIAQKQSSYLKDTTDYINFTENTKFPQKAILISMDITSLYTTIPPPPPPIPKRSLEKAPSIDWFFRKVQLNSWKKITCKGTKPKHWAPKWLWLSQISSWLKSRCKSKVKVLIWKRYTDYSLVNQLIEQANKHHLTIKFTAEISFQKLLS